jgi:hypothetical protein
MFDSGYDSIGRVWFTLFVAKNVINYSEKGISREKLN